MCNAFDCFKAPIDRESEDARNGAFILEVGFSFIIIIISMIIMMMMVTEHALMIFLCSW